MNFCEDIIEHNLNGFNTSLYKLEYQNRFAYGQTGSGKTYTLFGEINSNEITETSGLIPRLCQNLFLSPKIESTKIYCSITEIYNDNLYDVLNTKDVNKPLHIREDSINGVYLPV